ncbi:DWNN domain-containing protein [Powellomyces hirtus]|nr:DWNN domain-containing protein [Powellomyces hirtus]
MSVVFYKFKSAKDYDTCTFDGTNISVFDLKREILVAKKLGKGTDFDLAVFHAQTNEEYKDDMYQIPRNTSVLVSRQPATKPGKGTAQKYLTTSMPTGAMLGGSRARAAPQPAATLPKHHTLNNRAPQPKITTPGETPNSEITGETEEDRIANMFKMQTEQWAEAQDRMAHQKPIPRQYHGASRGGFRGGHQQQGGDRAASQGGEGHTQGGWQQRDYPQRAPPPGYICYRCGQKGHFINTCPTIGDKEFDRPKLKRTTGIPKIFLKVVDDKHAAGGGVMVTQNGELVVAQPNDQAWADVAARNKNYLGAGDVYEMAPVPDELACAMCTKLLRDAVQTPCCRTNYCDECVRTHLLDNEDPDKRLKCPNCSSDLSPDHLIANKTLRQAVDNHIKDFINSKRNVTASPSLGPAASAATPAPIPPTTQQLSSTSAAKATPTVPSTSATSTVTPPVAPIPLPNIPVINRRPAAAKPYKIIGQSKAADGGTSNGASASGNKSVITRTDTDQEQRPRRNSLSRYPPNDYPHAGDFGGPFPQMFPHHGVGPGFISPHMLPPMPDFDPRWGMMAHGPPMHARPFWDGPMHAMPPRYGPPPHAQRMSYGPGPGPQEYYGETWRGGSRDSL